MGRLYGASLRLSDPVADRRVAERRERAERERRRPRIRYVNSENMRAFCEGPGKGTAECRTFRRNVR